MHTTGLGDDIKNVVSYDLLLSWLGPVAQIDCSGYASFFFLYKNKQTFQLFGFLKTASFFY